MVPSVGVLGPGGIGNGGTGSWGYYRTWGTQHGGTRPREYLVWGYWAQRYVALGISDLEVLSTGGIRPRATQLWGCWVLGVLCMEVPGLGVASMGVQGVGIPSTGSTGPRGTQRGGTGPQDTQHWECRAQGCLALGPGEPNLGLLRAWGYSAWGYQAWGGSTWGYWAYWECTSIGTGNTGPRGTLEPCSPPSSSARSSAGRGQCWGPPLSSAHSTGCYRAVILRPEEIPSRGEGRERTKISIVPNCRSKYLIKN